MMMAPQQQQPPIVMSVPPADDVVSVPIPPNDDPPRLAEFVITTTTGPTSTSPPPADNGQLALNSSNFDDFINATTFGQPPVGIAAINNNNNNNDNMDKNGGIDTINLNNATYNSVDYSNLNEYVDEENNTTNFIKTDYSQLLEEQTKLDLHQSREIAWSGVLLGAAVTNMAVLAFFLIITRGKRGYFGVRLYIANLIIFAKIQILVLAWTQPDDYFGIGQIASMGVRDFLNKYNSQLLECTQIIYLSSTILLILDCVQRYRNNGIGISKLSWLLGVLVLDIIPIVYIFVKGINFEFAEIRPKPMAIYHAIVLAVFALCELFLGFVVGCVPFYRKCSARRHEELVINADRNQKHALREKLTTTRLTSSPHPKPFTYPKLVCLLVFVLLTGWTQYTVFNLGVDLQPGGLDKAQELTKNLNKDGGVQSFLKTVHQERLVFLFMSIQKWAAMVRPFLESLFAIIFLLIPSIGSKFQRRKIVPDNNETITEGMSKLISD